eukprot:CAMPEP_0117656078 /NCGR_PEP_ID=MMETSP0804-20121206/4616_1 /TAXON_ID=1074897 /ORGANISM="Tetraselmis astigmatica, Strain CCMP880" /LENGTH=243 /DNA_ID=CAMNT_0005462463 /DNA_START=419 /DNA_END=1150 /DNA_ORIENTATION=+
MAVIHNAPGSIGLSGSSRLSARLAFRLAFRRRTPAGAFVSTRGFFMPAAVNDPYSAPATAPGSFAAEVPLPELTATMASTGPAAKTATANYVQTASLTRVFIGIGAGARPLSGLLSGPMSVLVGFFMSVLSVFFAVRAVLVSRSKNCMECKGYGIQRCRLCEGQGSISWEGKFMHEYDCPLCFGKRHTRCGKCGGMHNKTLFQHTNESVPREPFTPSRQPLINPGQPSVSASPALRAVRTPAD